MANLIIDGFDYLPAGLSNSEYQRLLAANAWFLGQGSYAPNPAPVVGRFGFGMALQMGGLTYGPTAYVVPLPGNPHLTTGFFGFAMMVPATGTGARVAIGFYDAVKNNFQLSVGFEANGVLRVYRGQTEIAASEANAFQAGEWFHCEMKPTIDPAAGALEVRINTVPKVQLVGANTQNTTNAYFDSVFFGGFDQSVGTFTIDDVFFNDATGAANNTWSGNLRVKTQFMIGNGATDQFTIGGTNPAATNWQSVLNQTLDDTKYTYSATIGNSDLYTPNPNLNAPAVRAVQVRAALRQDDATQRSSKLLLRIGTTIYTGSIEHFTNQTFTFYKQRWDQSPATAVSFTGAEVNGLQAGLTVQS